MWIVMYFLSVIALTGVTFWAFRAAMARFEELVTDRAEEAVRAQRRRQQAVLGFPSAYHPTAGASLSEIEGVPADVYEAECAEVLRQLSHLRRQAARRPRTRRFARSD